MPTDTRDELDRAWDKKIGATLAFIRQRDYQQSQSEFAGCLGVSRSFLANIESGRTPLKAKLGWDFCKEFRCHPGWLCSGGNSNFPNIFPEINYDAQEIIARTLAKYAQSPFRVFWPLVGWLALEDKFDYAKHLAPLEPDNENGKNELTYPATSGKISGVKKNQWPELKLMIQKAVSKPGAKSMLAKFLGVDITQLSKWLTDSKNAREPGAEYALQMKWWVDHPESQT